MLITNYIEKDKVLIIKITEDIDDCTCKRIREEVDYEIEKYMPKITLFDFDEVGFMDSSGIGMLIGRYKNLMMFNSKVGLMNVKPSIKRIFEMSGIFKIMPIYENIAQIAVNC